MHVLRLSIVSLILGCVLSFSLTPLSFAASGDWWQVYAEDLHERSVIRSSMDGIFRPGDSVNRAEFARMINRSLGFAEDSSQVVNPQFSDVSVRDWFYIDVAALENLGVLEGTSLSTFSPERSVTRAESLKMITLAFDLNEEGTGIPFSDVEKNDWFYPYVSSAYRYGVIGGRSGTRLFDPHSPLLRAEAAKILSHALNVFESRSEDTSSVTDDIDEPETDTSLDETSEDTSSSSSPLVRDSYRVSIAPSSPSTRGIPRNAFNTDFVHFSFMNSGEVDIEVTSITLTRSGLGDPKQFTSVRLMVGNDQVGTERTFGRQSTATFTLARDPLVVSPGVTKTLRVVADLADTGSGSQHIIGIRDTDDIVTIDSVTGARILPATVFPIIGAEMGTSQSASGGAEYTVIDPHGSTGTRFGINSRDQLFTRIVIEATTDDIDLESITFRNMGSIHDDEIADLELFVGRGRLIGPVQMLGRYVIFNFGSDPYFIPKGGTLTLELRGDLPRGFEQTVGFDIERDFHIKAVSHQSGFPVSVMESSASTTITPDLVR